MHDIGFIKVGVCLVDFASIAILANVVIQVPTLVLIKYSQHGVLLLVCFQLWRETRSIFWIVSFTTSNFNSLFLNGWSRNMYICYTYASMPKNEWVSLPAHPWYWESDSCRWGLVLSVLRRCPVVCPLRCGTVVSDIENLRQKAHPRRPLSICRCVSHLAEHHEIGCLANT